MKKINFKILSIVISVLLLIVLSVCAFNLNIQPFKSIKNAIFKISPAQEIFLEAWNSVNSQYVDKSFNHQKWNYWKNRYLHQIKTKEDAYIAIDTMLESLNDPYTRFLSPTDYAEQNRSINAKLFGIGIYIANINNKIVVIKVIEDTPASKANIKQGDVITSINNVSTSGIDIKKAAAIIRGKAGSFVTVDILRDKKKLTKSIERKEINIKSVSSKMLKNDIAYIRIDSFISNETAIEMLNSLKKTQKAKGYIIDLRGNHGGLLPNAIYISNMFINKGKIVSIVDRNGNKNEITADPTELVTNKPVVILINQTSASASEIFSGAMEDHHRATLVGDTTFGKGCVQKIQKLPCASGINITIAKYLTPNGTDINKKGISPNFKIAYTRNDFIKNKDPQLKKAVEVIQKEIEKSSTKA